MTEKINLAIDALAAAAFIEGGVSPEKCQAARDLTDQRKRELVAVISAPCLHQIQEPASVQAVQPVICDTCNDHGMIGGPSFYDPGEGGQPCPDCEERHRNSLAAGDLMAWAAEVGGNRIAENVVEMTREDLQRLIAERTPQTAPAAVAVPKDWMEHLGFILDAPADGIWLVIDDTGAQREANLTERVLWKELMAIRAALAATPAAPVAQLDMDRVLSIADVHAEESREDGIRLIDRGGLVAFASDVLRAATPAAAAPVVLPEPAREILEDAVSILSSINHGKQHAVKVGDEVCYWQRQEWIDWAEKEVLPKLRALLAQAATGRTAQAQQPDGFVPAAAYDRLQALCDSQAARILAAEDAEPVHWRAVLDPEQVPQQLKASLHAVGFRDQKAAAAWIASELDFNGWRYTLEPLYAAPQAATATGLPAQTVEPHPDDVAVDALAALMKAKLAKQRDKGYGGWDTDCTRERLSELLRAHIEKGDPVDVANFCAFLSARGEGIAAHGTSVPVANYYSDDDGDTWRDCPDDCEFVEGRALGEEFELQASIRSWAEVFRVTKVPDETSDDYEVEPVSIRTTAAPQAQADARDAEIIWPKARDIGRIGDMSQVAHIRVGFDSDNDVFVSVWDENGGGSIEFCNPGGGGGGQSSRTRMALIALMVAMEADNTEKPSRDWWAQRAAIAAAKGAI